MQRSSRIPVVVFLSMLPACSTPGPLPHEIAAELPVARELSEADRSRADELIAAAIERLALRDHIAARHAADRALQIDPRAARALAVRARARQIAAGFERPPALSVEQRAEGELRLATRIAPRDPLVGRLHAVVLREIGHLTAAVQRAETALEAAPEDADLAELAATLRHDLGDERRAIPHFERALRLRPDRPAVLFRLAECRIAVTRTTRDADEKARLFAAAVAGFERYAHLCPADADGHLGVAAALAASSDEPEVLRAALTHLRTAAALDAMSPRADFNRGVVLDRLGEPENARAAYDAALARNGDHVPSLLNLAANQAAAGLDAEARATCRRALALDLPGRDRRRLEQFVADPATRR